METKKYSSITTCFIVLLCISSFCFIACKAARSTKMTEPEALSDTNKYTLVSVVDLTGLDGCTFALRKNKEEMLIPVNLADSLHTINQKLYIQFHELKGASTCMAGKLIELTHVEYAH